MKTDRGTRTLLLLIVLLLSGYGVWRFTPLQAYTSREAVEVSANWVAALQYPLLTIIGFFVVGSLVLFPITALLLLTALALPPSDALVAATLGVAISGFTGFLLGLLIGPERLKRQFGHIFDSIQAQTTRHALLTVIAVRHLPLGPFTLVNTVLGAMHISPLSFLLGNILSLLPTTLFITFFGSQLYRHSVALPLLGVGLLDLLALYWVGRRIVRQHDFKS